MYEAKKSHPIHDFKASCRVACRLAYTGPPIDGPVSLSLVIVFPRPQAMRWKSKPMPRARHFGKPDIDNVIKAVQDALNEILVTDDARISVVSASKWIAAGDEQPHVAVTCREL